VIGSCGDGFVNIGEECERDFSGEFVFGVVGDCVDYPDFVGGVLGCVSCRLDTSRCVVCCRLLVVLRFCLVVMGFWMLVRLVMVVC